MTQTKTIYKIKWKNIFKLFIILFFILCIVLITVFIFTSYKDYKYTKDMIETLNDSLKVTNVVDNDDTIIIEPSDKLSKFDSYWNYIKYSLISVDMPSIKKINSQAVGWIQLKGSSLNYPLVQSDNNTYYQNHSFNKKENKLGWIYLDYKNSVDELNINNVIYGNSTFYNVLFGTLDDVFKNSWKEDDDNYIIKYCTNSFTSLWQIVSVYKTDSNDHEKVNFNDNEFEIFVQNIISKSEIDFDTDVTNKDKIITLTTNSDDENIVIHAKLLKIRKEL